MMNKYLIYVKRTLKKPAYICLLLLLPLIAAFIYMLPDDSMSTNIYTGYINYDTGEDAARLNELLEASAYGFVFVSYDNTDDLYADVASKKLDCAYIIPEDFSENFTFDIKNSHIQVICSPATDYEKISMEVIYNDIISIYAPDIVKAYYQENDEAGSLYDETQADFIDEYYDALMAGDSLFTITTNSSDTYNGRSVDSDTFPFYGFTGIIIFIACMLGLNNYLKDDYEHIYDRVRSSKRLGICLMNILASALPAGIISWIALVIYNNGASALSLLLHIFIYIIICTVFCMIYRFIFRNYRIFSGAMAMLIICTLVFSPIFVDLSAYLPVIKYISYIFPATYF